MVGSQNLRLNRRLNKRLDSVLALLSVPPVFLLGSVSNPDIMFKKIMSSRPFFAIECVFCNKTWIWACNFDAKSLFIDICVINGTGWHPQTGLGVFSAVVNRDSRVELDR